MICCDWMVFNSFGAFRSSMFRWSVPSAVRCRTALLLLCFLIVGIHACPFWCCYVGVLCELPLLPCKCSNEVTINKLYFLPEWLMSGVVDVLRNCGDQLYLFLTVILFLSCGNLSRPEEHTTMLNSPPSSNLLRSYFMSLLIFRFHHNLLKANIFFQSLIKQSCTSCHLSALLLSNKMLRKNVLDYCTYPRNAL